LFKLAGLQVNVVPSGIDQWGAQGICFPTWPPSRKREVTIVLSCALDHDDVLPVLLHELIHAEQHALDQVPDHGAYFQWRVMELRAAGLRVTDHRGRTNA